MVKYRASMKVVQFVTGGVVAIAILTIASFFWAKPNTISFSEPSVLGEAINIIKTTITPSPKPQISVRKPALSYIIPSRSFISQTFNNCGPATLSMGMAYFGINVDQVTLGNKMRPYQHPTGDNDDKSIFTDEFVSYAKEYGLYALARPNGSIELLKKLTANDIPVIVRTWLHPNEDIGHFRIVRGYDDEVKVLIQDDSYEGPNLRYDYATFESIWQPFNYGYILVYPPEKQDLVEEILGEEFSEEKAWQNSLIRAQNELSVDPTSMYAQFNLASSYYRAGDYQKSVESFEKVEERLPFRMMWYQIEPILSYQRLGENDRVLSLTTKILENNNRAFSELYQIRGEVYVSFNNKEAARAEFEKAILYNKNFKPARLALENI